MAPISSKAREAANSSAAAGRRVGHAKRACGRCKLNKSRCDDVVDGKCRPCRISGHDCSWMEDARRAATKDYVRALNDRVVALNERIIALEGLLRKNSISFDDIAENDSTPTGSSQTDQKDGSMSPTNGDNNEDYVFVTALVNKLVLEDPSSVDDPVFSVYGAHSMFSAQYDTSISRSRSNTPFPAIPPKLSDYFMDRLLGEGPASSESSRSVEPWARNLPAGTWTRTQHDELVNLFFQYHTSWCLRLVPTLFWRDLDAVSTKLQDSHAEPLRTAQYSPLLHNSILACATAFSDDPMLSDLQFREKLALKAKSYIEMEASRPTLSTIHGLTILASYHSGRGDQGLGWHYFGMSIRMSSALGLDLDNSTWLKSGLINERQALERNLEFWSLFNQDKTWSLYVGRSAAIAPRELSLPEEPPLDLMSVNDPVEAESVASLYTAFYYTCKLMIIAYRIMEEIYGSKGLVTSSSVKNVVTPLLLALTDWYNHLPNSLRIPHLARQCVPAHILHIHLAYQWLVILLLRPFYRSIATTRPADTSVVLCNRAAQQIVQLLDLWRHHHGLRYVTITALQIAFTAGTTHLLAAAHATGSAGKQKGLDGVQECIRCLTEMGRSWKTAQDSARTLEKLREDYGLQSEPTLQSSRSSVAPTPTERSRSHHFFRKGSVDYGPVTGNTTWQPYTSAQTSPTMYRSDLPEQHTPIHSGTPNYHAFPPAYHSSAQPPPMSLFYQSLVPHMGPHSAMADNMQGAAQDPAWSHYSHAQMSDSADFRMLNGEPYPLFNEYDLTTDALRLNGNGDGTMN